MDLATLSVKVDTKDLQRASQEIGKLERPAQNAQRATSGLESSFRKLALAVGSYLTVSAALQQTTQAIQAFANYERQMKRLDAQLQATGRAGQMTVRQLEDMAQRIDKATMQSAEGVRQAQAVLMSFRNIATQDMERILNVAADVAEVMGGDIVSASRQMAVALEDPKRGLGMLRRTGTTFTEAQEKLIKS